MSDAVEELLARRLRAVGESVDEERPMPADLELRVARRRKHARSTRRWSSLAVAAAIAVTVTTVAVLHDSSAHDSIRVSSTETTAPAPVPVSDHLPAGTVMLAARGRYVISLDAHGHTNATMVTAEHGDIRYARATNDHREIWYLSLKKGLHACGDVVREDIDSGTTVIVAHAVVFDVSPDGSRLALYGAGDLAHDQCSPVRGSAEGRVVVVDLTNSWSAAAPLADVSSLRWSPDGSYLAAVGCDARACRSFSRIDVPARLNSSSLVAAPVSWSAYPGQEIRSAKIEFGPGGLYLLKALARTAAGPVISDRIERLDPRAPRPVTVFSSDQWTVAQVVPAPVGTYVVASLGRSKQPAWGLYRLAAGKLVFVRSLDDPGTLAPVTPLAATG